MDAVKIYEEYFLHSKNDIEYIIEQSVQEKKTAAIWGAGARGKAFLNVFDLDCHNIQYVFDIDTEKIGKKMPTGHLITDYTKVQVDIVYVMNNLYEAEINALLCDSSSQAEVVNIDSIVLGSIGGEEYLHKKNMQLNKVRSSQIAALVILYHGKKNVIDSIKTYSQYLNKVFVYDNTECPDMTLVKEIQKISKVQYYNIGKNMGLSIPINRIAEQAIQDGMEWLITFDQDSQPKDDMLEQMRIFSESNLCNDKIGIIAPSIVDQNVQSKNSTEYLTYYDKVYQSGAMHNLKILMNTGQYDEKLFIDQVDYEYCIRMRLEGYQIVKLNQSELIHNLEDNQVKVEYHQGKKIYIDKYTPDRYYYIYRNNKYLYEKYKDLDPIFALECENNLNNILLNVKFDTHQEKKREAIKKGESDYRQCTFGKVKWS